MTPTTTHPRDRVVALTAFDRFQIDPVKELLRDLPLDYPGAERWLDRRLSQVLSGEAECWTILDGHRAIGAVLLTPKPYALKLSTIYVREESRGRGLGTTLMEQVIGSAERLQRDEIYVTVADHKLKLLLPLLKSHGFTHTAVEKDRYGPNRTEFVFTRLAT